MSAIECLCGEHDLIQRVLGKLETLVKQTADAGRVCPDEFAPFVEFLRGFTVSTHFCKEEHGLFPLLHERGVPSEGSPLAALSREHEVLDEMVRELADRVAAAGHDGAAAIPALTQHATHLIEKLRDHVVRADHCMFGLATALLHDDDNPRIEEAFAQAERRAGDPETVLRWRDLGHRLAGDTTP